MRILFNITLVWSTIFLGTFSKGNSNNQKDCQLNNYGTCRVNFSASISKHSIIATMAGNTAAREKTINAGISNDTLKLPAGSYTLNIAAISSTGLLLESRKETVNITYCDEMSISVGF